MISKNIIYVLSVLMIWIFTTSCNNGRTSKSLDQPNILFLFADDHRTDAIGAYGNDFIQTPHLDLLASKGSIFNNIYCMGSHHGAVCAPSRSMLLTGKTLHRVYANLDTLEILPQILQEAGFTTFGTGKFHTDNYGEMQKEYKGFDFAKNVFFGGMSDHDSVPVRDQLAPGIFSEVKIKGFSSEIFAEATIDFLDMVDSTQDKKPFFAYVSFTAPHDPRTPPGKFLDMYDPDDVPLPANYMPVHPFHTGWMTGRDEVLAPWPREEETVREQLSEYYGLISHMDHHIGRIIKKLEDMGQLENTIIIFAADHGLAMGSHGLLGKQNLYEHSTKAPLIISGPDIPKGRAFNQFYYLLDLFHTIQHLAGVSDPTIRESIDISKTWQEEHIEGRKMIFTTYEDLMKSVRIGDMKLIRYPKIHHTQLFDLDNDPNELKNLSDDPAYADQKKMMLDALADAMKEFEDPHTLTSDSLESMVFDPSDIVRKVDRHQPKWIVEKYFQPEIE